jgi:hypothetical protein
MATSTLELPAASMREKCTQSSGLVDHRDADRDPAPVGLGFGGGHQAHGRIQAHRLPGDEVLASAGRPHDEHQ